MLKNLLATAAAIACTAIALDASAREAGDVVVTDNIGVPLYTNNFDNSNKSFSIGDKLLVSQFMGASYFVSETIRVGLMFQWTEQYTGPLAPGSDHFTTFALLPQIGWSYHHFQAAAIFTYAPRAAGQDRLDLGIQGLLGYSLPLTKTTSLNTLVEVPYNFHLARTLGVTPLVGLSFDL